MVDVLLFADIAPNVPGWGRGAGAYRIATELRRAGYAVQVIDAFGFWTRSELREIIARFVGPRTRYVGFSTTLMDRPDDYEDDLTRNPRKRSLATLFSQPAPAMHDLLSWLPPTCKVVVGGPKAGIRSTPAWVDHIVVGYGDAAAVSLAGTGGGARVVQVPYEQFGDTPIYWSAYDGLLDGEGLTIETGRGCIFKCTFCRFANTGKMPGSWIRDSESLRAELLDNYARHGTTRYVVSDDTLNDSLEKVEMLARLARSLPFQLQFGGHIRLDLIYRHPEMRHLLLEAGMIGCTMGIETLHREAGKAIGKGLPPERIQQTLEFVAEEWKGHILMHSGFIVGLPGEPLESVHRTYDWLSTSPLDSFKFWALDILHARTEIDDVTRSLIDANPERHGYSFDRQGWRNKHMTRTEAHREAEGLNALARHRVNPAAGLASPIRLLNLGYSLNDLQQMRLGTPGLLDDMRLLRTNVLAEYKARVLHGRSAL